MTNVSIKNIFSKFVCLPLQFIVLLVLFYTCNFTQLSLTKNDQKGVLAKTHPFEYYGKLVHAPAEVRNSDRLWRGAFGAYAWFNIVEAKGVSVLFAEGIFPPLMPAQKLITTIQAYHRSVQ